MFAKTPIIGVTATATKLIQQKIEESLGLITPIAIDVNPDRKNIHFSSLCRGNQGGERLVNILDPLLKDLRDKRLTIIYGNLETIANCFSYFTSKFGIEQYEPVGAPKRARNRLFSQYHAQYPEHKRQTIIIFGNGLDKSNIRQVIHIGGRTLWKNISKKLVEQEELGCQRELICFLRATPCDKPQKIKIALLLHTGRLCHVIFSLKDPFQALPSILQAKNRVEIHYDLLHSLFKRTALG